MMSGACGMMSGGLFNVALTGPGIVCFTTHGTPMTFIAGPNNQLFTDPNTTVAWSADLHPKLKCDVSVKSLFGMGSGEEFQMQFSGPGEGLVIVQPFEEHPLVPGGSK